MMEYLENLNPTVLAAIIIVAGLGIYRLVNFIVHRFYLDELDRHSKTLISHGKKHDIASAERAELRRDLDNMEAISTICENTDTNVASILDLLEIQNRKKSTKKTVGQSGS